MNEPTHITNWLRYQAGLTTSGQPTEAQIEALVALGVRHVINLGLHTHDQALADERATVTAAGMTYTHLPVAFDDPTEGDFDAFCAAMEAASDATVHIHCIMNWRVTAFLYRYQRDVLRMDETVARAQMERVWSPASGDDPRFAIWAKFIAPR